MKKPVIWIGLALLGICGVGSYALKSMGGGQDPTKDAAATTTVTRDDLTVTVIENGTIDAEKSVDVKGRVSGRLKKLFKDEGDLVTKGELLAIIDPQETQLQVEQNAAQLRGASSAAERARLEIGQRRITARVAYEQAKARAEELRLELEAQPKLTSAAIRQAQTALASAQQDRLRLVNSLNPTQRVSAETAVREAQANLDNSQRDYQRQTELEAKGYVSGKVVEDAKLQVDLAKARLDSATENFNRLDAQLKADVAKVDEQIRQTQAALDTAKLNSVQDKVKVQTYKSAVADVEKAKADMEDPALLEQGRQQNLATVAQLSSVLRDAQRQLGETDIRAPISGVVTKRGLQVGELATGLSNFSSGSTIVKIEDRSSMLVKLNMNEIDTAKLALGMSAGIDVDALPDEDFTGHVTKIAPASIDTSSTTGAATSSDAVVRYQVEIRLDKTSPHLRSGMSAKCRLNVMSRPKVLVVPLDFVGHDGKTAFLMVRTGTDPKKPTYEKKTVHLGISSGAKVEILDGIKEGDILSKPKYSGPDRKGMMQAGPD